MRKHAGFLRFFLWLLLLNSLYASTAVGQLTFRSASAGLAQNDQLLINPWAGGLRAPQAYWLRLAAYPDSVLLMFDRSLQLGQTYGWENGKVTTYKPELSYLLPQVQTAFWLWADMNQDGYTDGLAYEQSGLRLYLANPQTGGWLMSDQVLQYQGSSSLQPISVSSADRPALVDVDGDGDLDLLTFDPFGSGVLYLYQNQLIERGELLFERAQGSFGGIKECSCATFAFSGQACAEGGRTGERAQHAGGKAVLYTDMNQDGQRDLIIGFEECNELYVIPNQGSTANPLFDRFSTRLPAEIGFSFRYPVAYEAPGEQLYVAPYLPYTSDPDLPDQFSFLLKQENVGGWKMISDEFLQNRQWDEGLESRPATADLDQDGLADLVVAVRQAGLNDGYAVRLFTLLNIGTPSEPVFSQQESNWLGLANAPFSSLSIQFINWNQTAGAALLLVGYHVENRKTEVWLVPEASWRAAGASWQSLEKTSLPLSLSSVDKPWFYDVNADGLTDVLVGRFDGSLHYYRQQANGEFIRDEQAFLGIGTANFRRPLSPTVGDFTGSKNPDLFLADGTGRLRILPDFTLTSQFEELQEIYLAVADSSAPLQSSRLSWPLALPLASGHKAALLLGTVAGGLQLFHTIASGEEPPPASGFLLYPNPLSAGDPLTAEVDQAGELSLFDTAGRLHGQFTLAAGRNKLMLPLVQQGLYLAVFDGAEGRKVVRLLLLP